MSSAVLNANVSHANALRDNVVSKMSSDAPLIVGIGGAPSIGSSTEQAVALALAEARSLGARTKLIGGELLSRLPIFLTQGSDTSPEAQELVDAIRAADGLIIASPGYHGSVSGMVKNAIDYVEKTAKDSRPYLTDLPVGLIALAGGHQAAVSTLAMLRTIVHALRGWPTPFGAAICTSGRIFDNGACTVPEVQAQIGQVGRQVANAAHRFTPAWRIA